MELWNYSKDSFTTFYITISDCHKNSKDSKIHIYTKKVSFDRENKRTEKTLATLIKTHNGKQKITFNYKNKE